MAAVVVPLCVHDAAAQHANDTLCFTITLNADTNSIFGCKSTDDMRTVLSGPVIMDGKTLLFYSCNGYALYSQNGMLVDSHSVFRDNRRLSKDDPRRLRLAYPLDRSTILYFRKTGEQREGVELLRKKIYKKGLSEVIGSEYGNIKDVENAQLFNLCNNSITDEMSSKSFLAPYLVGYGSLAGGLHFWTLDRFFAFTSPIIVEENGAYRSFFTGLLHDQKTDVQKHLINPLGTYAMDGRGYYYGIHTALGSQDPESYQKLYLVDQAGNLLYSNELLKQVIVDAVLEYDKKNNTNYTVKRPGIFVFVPAVDKNGDIFYGVINFEKMTLEVKKRLFFRYFPRIVSPEHEDIINRERRFAYAPVSITCPASDRSKKVLPEVMFRDEKGKRRTAAAREISCKGYIVRMGREMNTDLKRKLSQMPSALPQRVRQLQDSLARITTTSCPYVLYLDHESKGTLNTFYYGCGEDVLCARIVNVTETFEIFVRVDLRDCAEMLVFSVDGSFLNRFSFNKENYLKRKDIIAVTNDRQIVEEDYEHIAEDYTYYRWELSVLPPTE
jgi:hypothetical protein